MFIGEIRTRQLFDLQSILVSPLNHVLIFNQFFSEACYPYLDGEGQFINVLVRKEGEGSSMIGEFVFD